MKEHLFTPGPTQIPLQIMQAMMRPTLHHRTKEFEDIFKEALSGYRWLTDSPNDPIFLACSGTGAMEAAVINCCELGDKVIYLNAGKFGERWGQIIAKLGLTPVEIKAADGSSAPFDQIESTLRDNRDAKAFCVQYCESATAVLHPVPQILELVRKNAPEMLTIVDAISCLGTLPIPMSKLEMDILIGSSQKALMLPPGLSMLSLSDAAWKKVEGTKRRTLYFDLLSERKAHTQNTTAWTPAMTIILGLRKALSMLREEGLDAVFARHALAARTARAGVEALGLEILGKEYPSPSLTAAYTPDGIDAEKVRGYMAKELGVRIAGGQEELKGRIIRIGHMGYMNFLDVVTALSALELALKAHGAPIKIGSGVTAALTVAATS